MNEKVIKNRKYYFVKNHAFCDSIEKRDNSCGQYRSLCISPIPSEGDSELFVDSQISSQNKRVLPLKSVIGRKTNRSLDSNSRISGNVSLKSFGLISKELFESLPESKVDPYVRSNSQDVCQTYCSDGTEFTPDSHNTGLQLNNSRTTSDHNKPFPHLPALRGLGERDESSVFTLIGRRIVSSDKSDKKSDEDNQLKKDCKRSDNCSGTLFGILASPKISSDRQKSVLSDQNIKTNELISSDSVKTSIRLKNDNYLNDKNDVKRNEREKIEFQFSVPQKIDIHSNDKPFCAMNEEVGGVKPLKELSNQVLNDQTKHLVYLKSPTIVKEVMKKMAALPSRPLNVYVGEQVSHNEPRALSSIQTIDSIETKCLNSSDAEAMLVIQELDKSIAEASPSTSNSPLVEEKFNSDQKRGKDSIRLNNIRPDKPPRLETRLIDCFTTTQLKQKSNKTFIEINETQNDNLIEELYFTDESGLKTNKKVNETKKIADIYGINFRECYPKNNISLNISDNKLIHRNIIDFQHNYDIKKISVKDTNDLDGAVARTSFSSIDSGTSSPNATHFIVVAIDFGTTFSGYSFAFTRDVDNAIHVMRKVEGCDPDVSNQKIPTILLLTPDGAFHSFGFAARDHYSNLEPKEAKRWFYFEKFKMNLHYDETLSLKTHIKSTNGNKSMSALTVFAHSLRYFKRLAIRELSDQTAINIINEDIRWVLTVPAIWKPSAKQFMRSAAYEAGIGSADNPHQLLIALEPEAASIYCRKLKMNQLVPLCPPRRHTIIQEKTNPNANELAADCQTALKRSHYNNSVDSVFTKGTKYIVVDVGGGTVDITCHQIQTKEGSLKEAYKAIGGPNGSIGVDLNFENLLSDVFGADFMTNFKNKRPAGYVDLMAAFEARKRSASPSQTTTSNISLPFSFINFFKKSKGISVENAVKKCSEQGITYCPKLGMLRLEPSLMQQLFSPVTQQIISHIWKVLNNKSVEDVSYLFLVGGFAESQILQSHIRNDFSCDLKVIIPQSPNLAILRGATLYGLDPTIISCRRARLTYGVGVLNKFIRGRHPLQKLAIKDGIEWCADIFDKFVVCDQSVGLFETITRSYTPVNENQSCSIIHIYCSERDDIQFITDSGVHRCGTLYLDLDPIEDNNSLELKREIRTQMIFGDTEIKVSALDVRTNKCVKAEIDFLNN